MRLLGGACVVGWLTLLGLTTHARTAVWQSDYTLWADAATVSPLCPRPRINYGRAALHQGEFDLARQQFVDAIRLSRDPRRSRYQQAFSYALGASNLAHVLAMRGEHAAALDILNDVIADQPVFPYARYNRGAIFAALGHCAEASEDVSVAQQALPHLPGLPCHASPR